MMLHRQVMTNDRIRAAKSHRY
ncbi:protein of unknown function (plasmid) [Rhodovastum atsumiense]|nr:protein of unknown function [Rhodovastum atsumiense]